jgi:L-lactate dehydrogenase complex protein LldF
MNKASQFKSDSEKIAFDIEHRKKIKFNISKYDNAVRNGLENYQNLEKAKQLTSEIKQHVVRNLAEYLVLFEKEFKKNGGQVIWAKTAKEANKKIADVLKKHKIELLVKSKSMVTEEIELNDYLEKEGIESIETDLGEFIVQVAGEKPYHIVTPAMHKSKEDVATLFHKEFKTPLNSKPEELTLFAREFLRKKYITAGAGITGANFLIAKEGAVALTENEGNGLMSTAFPKVHIAVTGIEKILPSIDHLNLYWPVLAQHGTGQKTSVYNTLFFGPKKHLEKNGPEHMYVVLLDNGRTNLYQQKEQQEALKCIKCGACLNYCPVYKNIGGYTYNTVYSGPIGSVITPHLDNFKEYNHLSFASSLCGKCTTVCPVKIDLHKLLLLNRRDAVINGFSPPIERATIYGYQQFSLNRKLFDFGHKKLRTFINLKIIGKFWGSRRNFPNMQISFARQFKEKSKK